MTTFVALTGRRGKSCTIRKIMRGQEDAGKRVALLWSEDAVANTEAEVVFLHCVPERGGVDAFVLRMRPRCPDTLRLVFMCAQYGDSVHQADIVLPIVQWQ